MKAPLPDNEAQRLEALSDYRILDTPPEAAFEELTRLASYICGTPIALISLVDANRQWFKSKVGLDALETPRDVAFCAHAILQSDVFTVSDATADERFATNPLVTSDPNIRFYAGAPLITPEGQALGTLCVIDRVPRNLSPEQVEALRLIGRQVIKQLEQRRNLANLTLVTNERKRVEKRRRQFFKRVAGGFGLASAILVVIGVVSYKSTRGLIEAHSRVDQTQDRLNKLEGLFSQIKDAETGQRGYILAGDERYLEPYDAAIATIAQQTQQIRKLTKDNPNQQRQLDTLEPLIDEKLVELKQTIDLGKQQGVESALQAIRTNQGKKLMDGIRSGVREMENEENGLLKQQAIAAKASARNTIITLEIAIFLTFVILCWLYYLIYREFTEHKWTEESLKQERNFISAVLDTASALVVVLDSQGKIVRFNRACEQTTGYSFDEVTGKYFWKLFLIPEEVDSVKASFAQLQVSQLPNEHENYWVTRDGSRRRIAWSNTALFDKQGAIEYIIGTGKDITEQKRAEQRLVAQHAVTHVLAESATLSVATPKILQAICSSLEWDLGELWSLEQQANALRCVEIWYRKGLGNSGFPLGIRSNGENKNAVPSSSQSPITNHQSPLSEFQLLTQQITFSSGVGLPGLVWASDRPIWIADVVEDTHFQRGKIAAQLGLHGAFGFPIKSGNEFLGVMTFFSRKIQEPDADLIEMMTAIGSQIGQFIKRKRAAVALRESDEKYRSVVDNIKEVIFQTDATGLWIFLNPAWTEITEFSIDESLGTHFLDYVHPDDRQLNLERFKPLLERQKEYCRHEIRYLTKNGGFRWIEVFARLTLSSDGTIIGTSGTLNDITQRKQAEEDLLKALEQEKKLNELKSRFVSMTSHEFRTPLTTILSSSELLKHYSHKWTDEKKHIHFNRIHVNVQRMAQMLDDVLLLGKAEAGKLDFNPAPLDLVQFCCSLVEELQQMPGNQHTLVFTQRGKRTNAYMDEKLLRQIIGNLLSNAIKYSPANTTVRFELTCEDGTAVFQIQDQGIGIPKEDQEQLFESFHRAKNVGKVAGTGLGLAIVKKAVDLHCGKISVNSSVGVGTTFTVTIPLDNQL